ncbi:hypothetical protein [Frigoribacterium sp. VKM Ac-2836]|nr:hypothetical protein [Frigoribacterium sp. VKM Ac-2836]NRD25860.1 hypothetical protein [Frigoribacterium sp. VKM Ac-2836]
MTLTISEGYPHGMPTTHADLIAPDILAVIRDRSLALVVAPVVEVLPQQ